MTDEDLAKIEAQLKIEVPKGYRTLMRTKGKRIVAAFGPEGGLATIFASVKEVADTNKLMRRDDAMKIAFPKWWETFFMIGTNGAGDFYCLRLDGKPGVWMIGTDCGDVPSRSDKSLSAFATEALESAEERRRAEAARKAECADEAQAELKAIAASKSKEAKAWFEAESIARRFTLLRESGKELHADKLRRYGVACCRLLPHWQKDADCVAALDFVERATWGETSWDAAEGFIQKLARKKKSPVARAGLDAIVCLLKSAVPASGKGSPTNPSLVADAVATALGNAPTTNLQLSDLLREVVGNPWLEPVSRPGQCGGYLVNRAATIDKTGDFTLMADLGGVLERSSIHPRAAAHCLHADGHVRGCWVIDEILGRPTFAEPEKEFKWDYEWNYPGIESKKLKARLKELSAEIDDDEVAACRKFAQWLRKQGDRGWASFIETRLRLDREPPGDDYVDLLEQWAEIARYWLRWDIDFPGFLLMNNFHEDNWWDEESRGDECGIPSFADGDVTDAPNAIEALLPTLDALTTQTPIRGVELDEEYAPALARILASPGGRRLRSIDVDFGWSDESLSALEFDRALATSKLRELRLRRREFTNDDAKAMAKAPLKGLRRLNISWGELPGKGKGIEGLLGTAWFQNLEWLDTGFGEDASKLAAKSLSGMKRLHTLVLRRPTLELIEAIAAAGPMKSLRRLVIANFSLTGENCRALAQWNVPRLIEFAISPGGGKPKDALPLCDAKFFETLQALTIDAPIVDSGWLEALAASRCAQNLRLLRLECGDSNLNGRLKSLGTTALARPNAFPRLTSLLLKNPYTKDATRDTARLLMNIASGNLRHLSLDDVGFDDHCAEAVASHSAFAKLTRLIIEPGFRGGDKLVSPAALERMFRSKNLEGILELRIDHTVLGNAARALTDARIMPNLRRAYLSDRGFSEAEAEKLEKARPQLRVC